MSQQIANFRSVSDAADDKWRVADEMLTCWFRYGKLSRERTLIGKRSAFEREWRRTVCVAWFPSITLRVLRGLVVAGDTANALEECWIDCWP